MKAIHIICRREGISLRNLVHLKDKKGTYVSGCWALHRNDDPKLLIGGWIYLHPLDKSSPSEIGGIVSSVGTCKREDAATEDGVNFTFEVRKEGRGQAWRGASHNMAWTGGIVDADCVHEATRA